MNKKLLEKIDVDVFTKKADQVAKKYNLSDEEAEQYLLNLGPKKMINLGLFDQNVSWRAGYTKPTIEKRKVNNRKKNKNARKSRRKNR